MLGKLFGKRQQKASAKEPVQPASSAAPSGDAIALPFAIRPAEANDEAAMVRIFEDAIDGLTQEHYSPRQRKAWKKSAGSDDFLQQLGHGITMVAENQGEVIAFAQLHPQDHVRMLYVSSEWSGLGISTLLYQYLEDEARIAGARVLRTDASLRARRFFEQMGFSVTGEEKVKRQGVSLARLAMQKVLVRD